MDFQVELTRAYRGAAFSPESILRGHEFDSDRRFRPRSEDEAHLARAACVDALAMTHFSDRPDLAARPLRLLRQLSRHRLRRRGKARGCCRECEAKQSCCKKGSALRKIDSDTLEAVQDALESKGELLPRPLRELLGQRFGFDLGQVRIHTDDRSAIATARLAAPAFAVGSHIVFAPGQYHPDRLAAALREIEPAGRRTLNLVVHELAHVLQQSLGSERGELRFNADPWLEREAEAWVDGLLLPNARRMPPLSPSPRSIQLLPPDQARAKCRAMCPLLVIIGRRGEMCALVDCERLGFFPPVVVRSYCIYQCQPLSPDELGEAAFILNSIFGPLGPFWTN